MTQIEFEELSRKQVKELNGEQDNEAVLEAWRDGYLYVIEKMNEISDYREFVDLVEELSSQHYDLCSISEDFKTKNQ